MTFCVNCGKEAGGNSFCAYCGTSIKSSSVEQSEADQQKISDVKIDNNSQHETSNPKQMEKERYEELRRRIDAYKPLWIKNE